MRRASFLAAIMTRWTCGMSAPVSWFDHLKATAFICYLSALHRTANEWYRVVMIKQFVNGTLKRVSVWMCYLILLHLWDKQTEFLWENWKIKRLCTNLSWLRQSRAPNNNTSAGGYVLVRNWNIWELPIQQVKQRKFLTIINEYTKKRNERIRNIRAIFLFQCLDKKDYIISITILS